MVVRVYVSLTSGDKEIKYRQQTLLQTLDSKRIEHEVIDIAEGDNKIHKEFMQQNATSLGVTAMEPNPIHPLPPQIFNDNDYCGDYEEMEIANENNELKRFLKLVSSDDNESYTSTADCKIAEKTV